MAAEGDTTIQALIADVLHDLFATYGKPEIALLKAKKGGARGATRFPPSSRLPVPGRFRRWRYGDLSGRRPKKRLDHHQKLRALT